MKKVVIVALLALVAFPLYFGLKLLFIEAEDNFVYKRTVFVLFTPRHRQKIYVHSKCLTAPKLSFHKGIAALVADSTHIFVQDDLTRVELVALRRDKVGIKQKNLFANGEEVLSITRLSTPWYETCSLEAIVNFK